MTMIGKNAHPRPKNLRDLVAAPCSRTRPSSRQNVYVVRRFKIDDDFDREGIPFAFERWDQEEAVGDGDERQVVLNLALHSLSCNPKAAEEMEIRMVVVPRIFTGCLLQSWPMRRFRVVR